MKTIRLLSTLTFIASTSFSVIAQTHTGDVQIIGQLSIGSGSPTTGPNGETFLLTENNISIRFDDNSTIADYSANDWEIEVNGSGIGGTDHFAILDLTGGTTPFKIEAAARDNALYIQSDGDVGIGTNNPAADLHVQTGNTPAIRLDQDGTSGWTAQVWDLAGNETNFFIRDVTNSSKLPFKIRPNVPTGAIDLHSDRIELNGNGEDLNLRIRGVAMDHLFFTDASESMVGIGTDAPTSLLDINGEAFRLRGITNNGSNGNDDGVPNVGKVLVSIDELGTARWEVNPLQEEFDLLTARVEALETAVTSCCGTFINETDETNLAELFQNYPNPFDESTIIEYYLPHGYSDAHLDVFGIDGIFITRFEVKAGGQGYVVLGANSLSAGNYIYSLFADGELIGTKQMSISH